MELKIVLENGLCLWMGPDDEVQVPMCRKERAACRKALHDALNLLDDTIVKYDTFSTVTETDGPEKQSSQHPDGCLGVFDYSPPLERPTGTQETHLRIVSSD